jgi:hypothetical protein
MDRFLTADESLAELITHMPTAEAAEYIDFKHMKVEAAYADCIFIVYQPSGRRSGAKNLIDQKPPKILGMIKVKWLQVDKLGAQALIVDEQSGQEMYVRHIPKRLFHYPIFISLPSEMTLRYAGQRREENVVRDLSFAFLIKTRNRSDFYSTVNTYMETPSNFKKLYPAIVNTGFTF